MATKTKRDLSKYGFGFNLAEVIPGDELKKIGANIVTDYRADKASRNKWEMRHANQLKLFTLQRDVKSWPWPNCSNVGLPVITLACVQFQARAVEALLSSGDEIVKPHYTGQEDERPAQRVAKYLNYQLTEEMDEFEESMDSVTMKQPLEGTVFKKTYYDELKKRVVSDLVSVKDLVIAYGVKRIEDADRITHVIYPSIDNALRMEENKLWLKVKKALEIEPKDEESLTGGEEHEQDEIDLQANESEGVEPGTNLRRMQLLEMHCNYDLNGDGIGEPYIITVDLNSEMVFRIVSRVHPNTGETLNFFTKYGFLPNPEGLYDIGFGALLEGPNKAMNDILNQLIDAGTLQNLQTGFYSKRSNMKRDHMRVKMGEFIGIDTGPEELSKMIMPFKFGEPSQVLYATLGFLQDYQNRLTTVTEVTTGEMPRSDTPAQTMMAAIEQGMKVFSAIHRRNYRSLKKELRKIYTLNGLYMDTEKYRAILGTEFATEADMGLELDFDRPMDIIPVADPQITSRTEKVAVSEAVYNKIMENPYTSQDRAMVLMALKDHIAALTRSDASKYNFNPQPEDVPPEEENAMIMRGQQPRVLPEQDHAMHNLTHQSIPTDIPLTAVAQKLLEAHMLEHASYLYMQAQKGEMNDTGELEGMAGAASDTGLPEGFGGLS